MNLDELHGFEPYIISTSYGEGEAIRQFNHERSRNYADGKIWLRKVSTEVIEMSQLRHSK